MSDIRDFCPLWGEWEADQKLGEGSFGSVWRVRRKMIGGKIYYAAVKHISIPRSEAEVRSLMEESVLTDRNSAVNYYDHMLRSLTEEIDIMHALQGYTNIVSYEDYKIIQKPDGVGYDIFLRMELLTPLTARIKNGITVGDVVRLGRDIAKAISILNAHHLVHRDIKPQNIFINNTGDFKLGDYGTARVMESAATAMSRKGTYNYMAPEIYNNQAADIRVDIYSLGLVLYRLTNGSRLPFLPQTGEISNELNEDALKRRLSGEKLPSPRYADRELSRIILKACAFRPQDRYGSAEELLADLEHYESREETLAQNGEAVSDPSSYRFHFNSSAVDNRAASLRNPDRSQSAEEIRNGIQSSGIPGQRINGIRDESGKRGDSGENNSRSRKRIIIAVVILTTIAAAALLLGIGGNRNDPDLNRQEVLESPATRPTITQTAQPTAAATAESSGTLTTTHTAIPTAEPAIAQTEPSTASPAAEPADTPTTAPTAEITAPPTIAPTVTPTTEPTATPTAAPTATPTAVPTATPTAEPTAAPTAEPTPTPTPEPAGLIADVGDIVTFGHYEQDGNTTNGKEDIEWIVLDVRNGSCLLLSRYGLDAVPFNKKGTAAAWETCTLRKWLNNEFLDNAFTADERSAILTTNVKNDSGQGNSEWENKDGKETEDKVFLLSYQEAFVDFIYSENTRMVVPTKYAIKQGALKSHRYYSGNRAAGWWWLRSSGNKKSHTARVFTDGTIGSISMDSAVGCIRPALRVDMKSDYFLSLDSELSVQKGHFEDLRSKEEERTIAEEDAADVAAFKTAGNTVTFGRCDMDGDLENGTEKIDWIVLEVQDGKSLLLAKNSLNRRPLHEAGESITWERCTLRKWLNSDFLRTVFIEEEQEAIMTTTVKNDESQQSRKYKTNGGPDTQDKVFLLSYHEVADIYFPEKKTRILTYQVRYDNKVETMHGWWWLRTPGPYRRHALEVKNDGSIDYNSVNVDGCIRPAIWVNTEADFFREFSGK